MCCGFFRFYTLVCTFLLFFLNTQVCAAVEFGKNKVGYNRFSWQYFRTPHFDVYFSQNQSTLSKIATQWIENDFSSLAVDFSLSPKERIPLVIFNSPAYFGQTNIINEIIPEGVGGFTTQLKSKIVIPFDGSYEQFRHVLHHELVHAFEFATLNEQMGGSFFSGSTAQMPLWFAEGLAEYLSSGWNAEADMFLIDAVIFSTIPSPGPELNGYMAYKGGQSFLYYMATSFGNKLFVDMMQQFKKTKNVETSFKNVYGKSVDELGEEWRYELKRLYWPEMGQRISPLKNSLSITNHTKDRSNFNLKPRISPDGNKVAFFSDKNDYTQILVTNRKGEVLQTISQSGFAGSFESFHPFRSGMCWAPDNKRLAIITSANGKDEIRIIDIAKKQLLQTIIPNVDAIFSPDWSHDGATIAFCAINKGHSDIFSVDVKSGSCSQLTNDIYSKSDPRFTRDCKSLFYSCQDSSGFVKQPCAKILAPYTQIVRLTISTKQATQVTHSNWNKKSPCFSSDGKFSLYVSDENGIDNIYISPLDNPDSAKAITDVIGGCSSPDVASDSSVMVYCLFQKGGWDIWQMTDPLKKQIPLPLIKTKWIQSLQDTSLCFFNPGQKTDLPQALDNKQNKTNSLSKQNNDTAHLTIGNTLDSVTLESGQQKPKNDSPSSNSTKKNGVIQDAVFPDIKTRHPITLNFDTIPPHPYKLKFAPDIIALGVGTNTYYGYGVAGQCMAIFSDMLGDHQIAIMGDIQGNLKDYTHLFASYLNRVYRVNFGGGLFYNREYSSQSFFGDSIVFDVNTGGMFLLRYPFSMFSRIDLLGMFENLYRTPFIYKSSTGSYEQDQGRPASTINIFTPSLSYVYDNILWGITGPLNGIRTQARLEVSPPIKELSASFASFDVDFREYFHLWKRFVWANKLAFGASIPLRDEMPSKKFFLGGNENWFLYGYNDFNSKGYHDNVNNFVYSDIIVPFRGWGYLDLIGTKFAVFNTEFRFPFIKEFSVAWPLAFAIRYVNGAVFADAGNAWDHDQEFDNIALPKKIYGGIGYGLRANLGIFLLRYDRAWKTDWNTFTGASKDYFSLGAEF